MLLNFWRRVWRTIWKRYCSGVFYRHSDQYHEILNMGRKSLPLKNSGWKIEHWLENTRSITWDVDRRKKVYIYQKWPRAGVHFNKIHTNTFPFHSVLSGQSRTTSSWIQPPSCTSKTGQMSGDTKYFLVRGKFALGATNSRLNCNKLEGICRESHHTCNVALAGRSVFQPDRLTVRPQFTLKDTDGPYMCKHAGFYALPRQTSDSDTQRRISLANKVSIHFITRLLSPPPALPPADASLLCEFTPGISLSNNLNPGNICHF